MDFLMYVRNLIKRFSWVPRLLIGTYGPYQDQRPRRSEGRGGCTI